MVAVKIRRGGDFRGVMEYLAADKEGVQREDPHVVAGLGREGERLDTETVRSVAVELDAPRQAFGVGVTHQGKPGHVWHTALSFDRPLGDDEMRRVTEEFMRRMDFGPARWVAVRHGVNSAGCDHVHIVASMVRDDGKRARDFDDQKRASKAAGVIERKYGLGVCEGRELGIVDRGYHGAEKAIAERLHGKGTEPAPDYIRRVLRAAVVEAPGRENFTRYLAEHDVTAHPGRMGGFSYSVPGSRQYQGSKLAPDLSWPRIEERWASPVPQTADQAAHRAAGRLAAASLRTERRPGPLARESRELGRFAQTRAGVSLVLPTAVAQLLRQRIRAAERAAAQADEYVRGLDRGPRRAQARDRGAELDL